jgi:hypothetical protein
MGRTMNKKEHGDGYMEAEGDNMSWFHRHEWQLIGKTYVEGSSLGSIKGPSAAEYIDIIRAASDKTTFLWKCSHKNCSAILKEECLGREV